MSGIGQFIVSAVGALAVFGLGHWSGRSPSRVAVWIRRQIDALIARFHRDQS
jgi:hypothetical protein